MESATRQNIRVTKRFAEGSDKSGEGKGKNRARTGGNNGLVMEHEDARSCEEGETKKR